MTKLLRFGFEIGIPSAPITQKLKATTKTDENKLVISWAHRLRGARAGSTLREMLTQLPQPATVNISRWLPIFHLRRCLRTFSNYVCFTSKARRIPPRWRDQIRIAH